MKRTDKYSLNIGWSEEDQMFVATSSIFGGLTAFGNSKEDALREGEIVLEEFLNTLEARGEVFPDPDVVESYSGQFRIRMPKSLHRKLAESADKEGVSLNQYAVAKLSAVESEERALKHITNIINKDCTVQIVHNDSDESTFPFSRQGAVIMKEIAHD